MDLESDDEDKENGGEDAAITEETEEVDEKEKSHDIHRKVKELGYDYNKIIQTKKAFRNPSIYEKLILHCDIDEFGTNFPPELYDGHLFGKESYYDELAKAQKEEMDRREKQPE